MFTLLGKRQTLNFQAEVEHKLLKKLKEPAYCHSILLENRVYNHLGFMWKSLKYIKSKELLLTIGVEGCIVIWDVSKNFQYLRSIKAFSDITIYAVEYIEDMNAIACASTNFSPIKVFSVETGEKMFDLCVNEQHFNFLDIMYVPKMNLLVAGGFDRTLLFINMQTREIEHSINTHYSIGTIKYLEKNNAVILGLWGGNLKLVDLKSKKVISSRFNNGHGYVMCLKVIEEKNLVISCGDDGKISLWQINRKKDLCLTKRFSISKNYLHPLRNVYMLGDQHIFFVYKNSLVVLNLSSGKESRLAQFFRGHNEAMLYTTDSEGMDTLFIADHKQGIFCLKNLRGLLVSRNIIKSHGAELKEILETK